MSGEHKGIKTVLILIIIGLIIFIIVNYLNSKYTKLEYGETVKLNNGIEFSITSNRIVKELLPTNYVTGYSYYNLFDNQKSILDVKVEVKNSTKNAIKINTIFEKAELMIDKEYFNATIAFEDVNGRDFLENGSGEIDADQTRICHFCLSVNDTKMTDGKEISLRINAYKEKYEYKMQLKTSDETVKNDKSVINLNYQGQRITQGEVISIPDVCNFKILSVGFVNRVEPTNKEMKYNYFTAGKERIYLDAKILVESLSEEAMLQEDMLGYCTLTDSEGTKYSFTKIVEENNGTNLSAQTNVYKIIKDQLMTYHLISEVPIEVKDAENELFVNLYINGETYIYQVR